MCHGRKVSYTVEVQSLAGQLFIYITEKLYTRECIISRVIALPSVKYSGLVETDV